MNYESDEAAVRRRAKLRIALGMAQTIGAAVTATLALLTGVNEWSIAAGVITAGFTLSSLLLFRRDDRP